MRRLWELHRKQNPKTKEQKLLPPIIPLVLYHGKQRWQVPEDFLALFGNLDDALTPYVPNFRYALCDLNLPEPEQIRGTVLSRLIVLALKHIFDLDPKAALAQMLPLVRILEKESSLEMLEVLLRYYVQTSKALDENDIHELINETVDGESYMQTFIDRYIEQGRQKGLFAGKQEGLQEGLQEGQLKGRMDILLRQVQRKFGVLTEAQRRRIEQADAETLLRWSESVLFAANLDEVLR